MSDLATTTTKKRPVQIDLSTDLIAEIEVLAAEETLTRTAWMRRILNGAVKAATEQQRASCGAPQPTSLDLFSAGIPALPELEAKAHGRRRSTSA
jgi:hypothetical protein